jgi:ERCC4-type nuclease
MPDILSVMIDSREPQWVQSLGFGGVPTVITMLAAGDFLVATSDNCLLGIERKTSGDLLNTLGDDRLFPQLTRLRELTEYAYLMITGPLMPTAEGKTITHRVTGWDWSAVQGALLTVQEIGVNIIYATDDLDLEPAIIRLAKRRRENARVLPPRQATVYGPGEAAIAQLPGIGIDRLEAVLQAVGAPFWALVALTQKDGEHIPGIGPATKQRIRNALGLCGEHEDLELVVLPTGAEVNDGE